MMFTWWRASSPPDENCGADCEGGRGGRGDPPAGAVVAVGRPEK